MDRGCDGAKVCMERGDITFKHVHVHVYHTHTHTRGSYRILRLGGGRGGGGEFQSFVLTRGGVWGHAPQKMFDK